MTNGQRPAQGSAGPNQAAAVSPADSVRGLPTAPLLLVSPHLDDAMLSAFALLTGEPVDVLTVFTGRPVPAQHTGWDAICGFDDSTISITTRLGENEAAFAGWDHRLVELDLLDVQYRDGPVSSGETARLKAWVGEWLDAHPGGVVAIPAGAGLPCPTLTRRQRLRHVMAGKLRSWGARRSPRADPVAFIPEPPYAHPDHTYVRDTLIGPLLARGAVTVLYEEVPYLWGQQGEIGVAQLVQSAGITAHECRLDIDRHAKAARVGAYRSQVPVLYAPQGPLDSAQGLPTQERFWTLSLAQQGTSGQNGPL